MSCHLLSFRKGTWNLLGPTTNDSPLDVTPSTESQEGWASGCRSNSSPVTNLDCRHCRVWQSVSSRS